MQHSQRGLQKTQPPLTTLQVQREDRSGSECHGTTSEYHKLSFILYIEASVSHVKIENYTWEEVKFILIHSLQYTTLTQYICFMIYRTYVELAPLCLTTFSLVSRSSGAPYLLLMQWVLVVGFFSAWIAMAEAVAWGMGALLVFFFCWPLHRVRASRLTTTVSPSQQWKMGEIDALMLTAGWQASCFLQQGNICRGTEQIY